MKKEEPQYVDYSDGLPEDLDEETLILLKLAKTHITAKEILASKEDINNRSKEKHIPHFQARKELLNESELEREQIMNTAKKALAPKLSKETKQKLGIKEAGRPKGSKGKPIKTSKSQFYERLKQLIKSKNQIGESLLQKEAAEALGLGGTRQLRSRLREYGEKRKWHDIRNELETKQK